MEDLKNTLKKAGVQFRNNCYVNVVLVEPVSSSESDSGSGLSFS